MEQRISVLTLGVRDLEVASRFYQALGWRPHPPAEGDDVVFFQVGGIVVGLWGREQLAEDSCVDDDAGGWGGVTLAHNVADPATVDAVLARAEAAGARIGRPGAPTSWGGYGGVFVDPDGHPWEVAHNPGWTITADGATLIDPPTG